MAARVQGTTASAPCTITTKLQQAEDLVKQCYERVDLARIEQARHGAEQVAEEVALSTDCRDVEHDAIQMDDQPEQIEIEGPQLEMKHGVSGTRYRSKRHHDVAH